MDSNNRLGGTQGNQWWKSREMRKTGEGGREGRRWKANTLPWFRESLPPSLIPGKDRKMRREGKKSNLSDWAKGHGALLVNKQPLCNWPWGDKNRKDSTLSPIASAPWQALNYRFSFPHHPPFSTHLTSKHHPKVAWLPGKGLSSGQGQTPAKRYCTFSVSYF